MRVGLLTGVWALLGAVTAVTLHTGWRRLFGAPSPPSGWLATADTLNLSWTGDAFTGTRGGSTIALTPMGDTHARLTVGMRAPFAGTLQLSGPSANATGGPPEVKLRVGDGAFDTAFWIARAAPRGYGATLLATADVARSALLAAPFGVWQVGGRAVSYETRRALTADEATRALDALLMLATLSDSESH